MTPGARSEVAVDDRESRDGDAGTRQYGEAQGGPEINLRLSGTRLGHEQEKDHQASGGCEEPHAPAARGDDFAVRQDDDFLSLVS